MRSVKKETMDEQAAVAHLEAMAQNAIGAAADADMPEQQKTALWAEYKALDTALTALRDMLKRSEGCKWCIGKVNDKYATIPHAPMIHATKDYPVVGLDVPYRFCCNCGRELSGNAEQVKEVEG